MTIQLRHILFFVLLPAFAIGQNYPSGAKSASLGHASVALSDLWASYNNQAGLAFLEAPEVGAFFENRFLMQELNAQGVAFAMPFKKMEGTLGINLYRFGYSNFNDNKLGVTFAKKFGKVFSAGIQLNLHYFQQGGGYESILTATGELSLLLFLSENWTLGAHVFNPTRTSMASFDREKIPTVFRLGTAYAFSNKVQATIEIEKDLVYDPTFRAGVEYKPGKKVAIRAGLNSNPISPSFGLGLNFGDFVFDAASAWHQVLGFSPQAALTYKFNRSKSRKK
jgi:hypothetical protein